MPDDSIHKARRLSIWALVSKRHLPFYELGFSNTNFLSLSINGARVCGLGKERIVWQLTTKITMPVSKLIISWVTVPKYQTITKGGMLGTYHYRVWVKEIILNNVVRFHPIIWKTFRTQPKLFWRRKNFKTVVIASTRVPAWPPSQTAPTLHEPVYWTSTPSPTICVSTWICFS